MNNVFKKNIKRHSMFSWGRMGDVSVGRPTLGPDVPVLVYRMSQYSLLNALTLNIGKVKADYFFIEAGRLAGYELAMNVLHLEQDFQAFAAELRQTLLDFRIGILTLEKYDAATGDITLAIENDLDCSGLDNTDEAVCSYDEGLLSGVMDAYTGDKYEFEEVDCWSKGDRLCRFSGRIVEKPAKG